MEFDFYVVGQKDKDTFVLYDARQGMGGRACVSTYTIQQLIEMGYTVCGISKQSYSASLRPKDIVVVNQQGQPATRIPTHDDIPDTKRSATTVSKGLRRSRAEKQKAKAVGEKRSQAIQNRKKNEKKDPLVEVYKIELKGGIKRLTVPMVNFLYPLLVNTVSACDFEQLQSASGQPMPVYYCKTDDTVVTRNQLEAGYAELVKQIGLTDEGYVNFSFTGRSPTPRNVAAYMLKHTEKPIYYTHGLSYRNPTTHNVPISVEEAFDIWSREGWADIHERADGVYINTYSANDMW